jgi:hypothetical protein
MYRSLSSRSQSIKVHKSEIKFVTPVKILALQYTCEYEMLKIKKISDKLIVNSIGV